MQAPDPRKGQKQDAQIKNGIEDGERDSCLETKGTVLGDTCQRTPVGGKVQSAVEDEAEEEGNCESDSEDDENQRGPLEARPCEDATVEEQESEFRETNSERLHDKDHVHTLSKR